MNRICKASLAATLVGLLLIVASTLARQSDDRAEQADQLAVGFPFEIKQQRTFVGLGKTTWWEVTLILSKEYYARENLERIFRYYSGKYPDKKAILRVSVFADPEVYERHLKSPSGRFVTEATEEDKARAKLPAKDTWSIPHATYERLCYNEYYYYSPDPDEPDKRERVILSGKSQTLTFIPPDCDEH